MYLNKSINILSDTLISTLSIILFLTINSNSFCQTDTSQGIFPSSDHYKNDSVLKIEDGLIKLNIAFKPEIVILKNKNEKLTFSKDSIYGYCKENICYRFYKKEEYKIEDTGYIYIYSRTEIEYESKLSVKHIKMYFSENADSEIQPLTVHNLLLTLPFPTEEAIKFKEMHDDHSILKHHSSLNQYDINIHLENIFNPNKSKK